MCKKAILDKSEILLNSTMATNAMGFLTEAPILWHFDLECHIRIETNASRYAISEVFS